VEEAAEAEEAVEAIVAIVEVGVGLVAQVVEVKNVPRNINFLKLNCPIGFVPYIHHKTTMNILAL